jgi:biotin operon repressor
MAIDLTCFNWVQLIKKADLPPNAKLIAFHLSTFMNMEHDIAWPSQARISAETGLARSTVVKWIDYLCDQGWLVKRSRAKVISTLGGPQAQNEYLINVPQKVVRETDMLVKGCPNDDKRLSVQQPKVVRQPDTNNNRITMNNNKSSEFSADDFLLAEHMQNKIKELNPKARDPNLKAWAKTMRLMRERDKRTPQEIRQVFDWANNHDFWQSNILSPGKLREQFDRLQLQMGINGKPKKPVTDDEWISLGNAKGLPAKPGEEMWQYKQRLTRVIYGT